MKRLTPLFVIVFLIFALIIGGCASKEASKKEGTQEEQPKGEETFELIFSYFAPEVIPPSQIAQMAADRIEEKSGGRIKIETYYGETLLSHADTIPGCASGVADIVMIDSDNISSQFELNKIYDRLIETTVPGRMEMTLAYRELLKEIPELQKELEDVGVRWLSVAALPGYNLHTVNKKVVLPEDIKALSIEIMGDGVAWVESMGASAVSMFSGDVYMSLERGLINGQFTHWAFLEGFQTWDLFTHHTVFGDDYVASGIYAPCIGFLINTNTWNSLPQDLQEIIVEAYDWANDYLITDLDNEVFEAGYQKCVDANHEVVYLTAEERQQWIEFMGPINEKWIEETEAKGLPARKTYEKLIEIIEQYQR